MVELYVHNIKSIKIDKYSLDNGCKVLKIRIKQDTQNEKTIITLFTHNKEVFKNIKSK